jgi:hypothetical protein
MITGQAAFLAMVIVGMISLPLTLAWAVLYTNLGDRQDRNVAAPARASTTDTLSLRERQARC